LFSKIFTEKGLDVTPIDVRAYSYFPDIQPTLYDGTTIPFADNSFDVCVAMAVLHHTPNPEALVGELVRVSRGKLIILEDIVTNPFQRYYTYAIDSIMNREFIGHPHTNKSHKEWKALFSSYNLRLKKYETMKAYGFLINGIYYLEK